MYRAAVIGCGRIGCGFDDDPKRKTVSTHSKAYSLSRNTKLIALCDIDKDKLEKYGKRYSVKTYTDYNEMFSSEKLDLVSICTLESEHHKIAIAASNAGVKGIFCEKPIADTISHAEEMIEVCNSNKTVLLIDHQRRFDPLFSIIKKKIENDLLGTVYHSTFYYTAGIFNTGTHLIDLLRYFFGDIEWVIGKYSEIKSARSNDPNIDGIMKFENGVTASIHALDVKDYLIFEQDIVGSKGRLRIHNSGSRLSYQRIIESKQFSGYRELSETPIPFKIPIKREYMLQAIKHLTKCVEDYTTSPLSSGQEGLKDLQSIFALIKSAENSSKKILLTRRER